MSIPEPEDRRIAAAREILREEGLAGASVRVEGREGEIAVLSAPREAWGGLLSESGAGVVRRVKALGFRYVALDLDAPPERR